MRLTKIPELQKAALIFKEAFAALKDPGLDPYNASYLMRYQQKLNYQLYLSCHILEIAWQRGPYKRVIDIGGGIGFQSAFLSSLKNGWELHYLDADPESMRSAKKINENLGALNINYHLGELSDLKTLIDKDCLLLSRDVIEHIYDLPSFFALSSNARFNVHNTAAVKNSCLRKREFAKIHHSAEHIGNSNSAIKARDSAQSYHALRAQMIRNFRPQIEDSELIRLCRESRGLNRADLVRFLESGEYPAYHLETLASNSCDPNTGNWAERLLSKKAYEAFAGDISLEFHYPKYNSLDNSGVRKHMLQILNIFARSGLHQIQPSFSIAY